MGRVAFADGVAAEGPLTSARYAPIVWRRYASGPRPVAACRRRGRPGSRAGRLTVDVASHGRLFAGIGAGWYEHEWRAYGYEWTDTPERMGMFREAVQIIHKMWTEDTPVFEGKRYAIDGPINEPKSAVPGKKIPLWIGGGGEKVTLKLVAQYG
ncbi:MAG: LLM class flavin-dependent oxidoreductase, partial [Chloroflexia bacterium]|nr:LLM class flavin-dependent oxidoreductase [Chloroflexia bacterium]